MVRARASVLAMVALLPTFSQAQRGDETPIPQWHHTALTGDDGPPRPGGDFMVRTPDGYLWMNAYNGLMRFDGIRFTLFDSTLVPELRGGQGYFTPRFIDTTGAMWVQELTQPGGVELKHSVGGHPRQLPPEVVTTILRIAKEAVANAMKHAAPSTIVVQLTYEPRRVLLEIVDDGSGCDPATIDSATARGHWGCRRHA